MTDAAAALAALEAAADPARAVELAHYHKAPRRYLGLTVPQIETLVAAWRAERGVADRVRLAARLWDSDVHEARIAAAKLLTQARLREDEALVWGEFLRWLPTFDALAVADHACKAGERRLMAFPNRLDAVEGWIHDPNMWVRRAALIATLPWTKQNHPTVAETAVRVRILGWVERLVSDRSRFVQKALATWLRSLSIHDPVRTREFLDGPGSALSHSAGRDASRRLA